MLDTRVEIKQGAPVRAESSLSLALIDALVELGCRRAFGILGGAAVPFFSALVERGLRPVHTRHESGAVFIALEHELAGAGPGLVFTTTGPGLTNALTGVAAARREGGRVVIVSASTGPDCRGRGAFQESDAHSYAHCGLYAPGGWFDYAVAIESPAELGIVRTRLAEGLARPQGFVAHVALPLSMQTAPVPSATTARTVWAPHATASPEVVAACATRLREGPVVLWLGYGARTACAEVRALAQALDARVMCSSRAKGLFPENDPRFLGVTGFGGHARVFDRLAREPASTTLVLGTRLGEFTSFWDPRLVGTSRLVHVDVDGAVFGAAYPDVPTLAIQAEVRTFVGALLHAVPCRVPARATRAPLRASSSVSASPTLLVRPSVLMESLQRVVVEQTDVPVMAEAGNAFLWTTHALRFDDPGRFRTSMGFGSMGHFTAGVVGAAVARSGPALAVVGDGAMLMSNEVSTAASLGVPAIWVVLNDGRYGLVADGMSGLGHAPVGLDFHAADIAALARALGATGIVVDHEQQLDDALSRALALGGPVVVDVRVDRSERAPFEARNRSLTKQQGEPRRSGV